MLARLTIVQQSDQTSLAVSKLCCPICWEFLQVLRGLNTSPKFDVQGHHTNFYAVDLPDWLPSNVIREMVTRFQKYLIRELRIFNNTEHTNNRGHARLAHQSSHNASPSVESVSGLSVTSESSIPNDPRDDQSATPTWSQDCEPWRVCWTPAITGTTGVCFCICPLCIGTCWYPVCWLLSLRFVQVFVLSLPSWSQTLFLFVMSLFLSLLCFSDSLSLNIMLSYQATCECKFLIYPLLNCYMRGLTKLTLSQLATLTLAWVKILELDAPDLPSLWDVEIPREWWVHCKWVRWYHTQ